MPSYINCTWEVICSSNYVPPALCEMWQFFFVDIFVVTNELCVMLCMSLMAKQAAKPVKS